MLPSLKTQRSVRASKLKNQALCLVIFVFFSCDSLKGVMKTSPETTLPPGLQWASRTDLSGEQFSTYFQEYKNKGWIIKAIDAYKSGLETKYAMIWEENTDLRAWAEWRDLSSEEYHKKWEEYKALGWKPTAIECYQIGSNNRYAGIWEENKEGIAWSSHRNLTATAFDNLLEEKLAAGFRLVDIEAYYISEDLKFSALWYENPTNLEWAESKGMTRTEYREKIDDFGNRGFKVIDFESYTVGNEQKYAAIWEKNLYNHKTAVRTDKTEIEYANYWRLYNDMGYRLIDFESYSTPSGRRYAGVWTENNTIRSRYSKQEAITALVSQYQIDNNIAAVSVAVAQGGQVVYQRGFGEADKLANKKAHGKSVYLIGSISKVIGGTLAAKLEAEGQLRDGTGVSLDLTQPTTNFLAIPNNSHSHTVEQLFSHTGCMWHYSAGPEPIGIHFNNALAATQQLWNTPTLANCTIGSSRNYSTHAFTFIGAVLESVTNRPISQLVEEEIADQYGLSSMKVMFKDAILEADYERVAPYLDTGLLAVHNNNSWKVLGGGIECNAVDLVRFGYKHLTGEIIDASTRDNRLWKPVNSYTPNGIAWDVRTRNGRRVAEHGGSFVGALSHLRVYRDDDLVIVVLSNQRGHAPRDLIDAIEKEILNP